jgi:2-polyprenyl-3-methyl-5-hydroxy-6-metoxy-1,4-benzoquinol methylase
MNESGSMKDYYDGYWRQPVPAPVADPLAPRRLELLRERLSAAAGRKVLDAGSGHGDLVAQLGGDGFEAVGLELSPEAIRLARSRNPGSTFLEHSVEDVPWPVEPGTFDAVVSFEVIEHLMHPRALLVGAHGALRPGGQLALSTPYHGFLKNLAVVLLAFDKHFGVEGEHIRFFSDRALRRLLGETGFTVERIDHYGRFPGIWAGTFVWARKI